MFRHDLSFLSSSGNKVLVFLIYTANLIASSGRARVPLRYVVLFGIIGMSWSWMSR